MVLELFRGRVIPSLNTLLGYLEATHVQTIEFVATLTPERLDTSPGHGDSSRTFGASLRHLITHQNNHHGQIDYIRGLQDEAWDLPRQLGLDLS